MATRTQLLTANARLRAAAGKAALPANDAHTVGQLVKQNRNLKALAAAKAGSNTTNGAGGGSDSISTMQSPSSFQWRQLADGSGILLGDVTSTGTREVIRVPNEQTGGTNSATDGQATNSDGGSTLMRGDNSTQPIDLAKILPFVLILVAVVIVFKKHS